MQVQKVEQNKSYLGNGIKSAAIGGIAGLVTQYALPLTNAEKDNDYKIVVKNIKKSVVNANKGIVEILKNNNLKQPAVDTYVKSASKMADAAVRRYNWQLKTARGAVPFVAAGAITGFLTSFISKTFRTDVA